MPAYRTIGSVLALTAVALIGGQSVASAHPHKRHHRYHHHHHQHAASAVCKARVEGRATGQGLFGTGTQAARAAAQTDWENKAAALHGQAYASLGRASLVRWDCKKNAILKAKCVVTARPCA